jgi:hypothetical protein
MPAVRIVEALNIIEDVGLGLIPRSVDFARCSLALKPGARAAPLKYLARPSFRLAMGGVPQEAGTPQAQISFMELIWTSH